MPAYLNTLLDATRTLLVATWTDVPVNGVYRASELAAISWDTRSLPLAVLDHKEIRGEWGMTNRTSEHIIWCYYVHGDVTTPDGRNTKLEALRSAFMPDAQTNPLGSNGQVLEWPLVDDSAELPVNQYFLTTGKPVWAGAVILHCLAGVTTP